MSMKTIEVDLAPATIYTIPAKSRPTNGQQPPLIYFVPGNPGVVQYYIDYLDRLSELLPEYEILATSHAGFVVPAKIKRRERGVYSLDEQVNQKVDILLKHIEETPRDVYIFGHSVGAWMVQRVVLKLPSYVNVRLVGLITPTIKDIAKSPRGELFVGLETALAVALWLIQILLWAVPDAVLRWVIKTFLGKGPAGRETVVETTLQQIRYPTNVEQVFEMAREEMDRIGSDDSAVQGFWKGKSYKVWMFFVENDWWVPESTRRSLIETYGTQSNVIVTEHRGSMAHSFCIKDGDQFAEETANVLRHLGQ